LEFGYSPVLQEKRVRDDACDLENDARSHLYFQILYQTIVHDTGSQKLSKLSQK
jgi:hypothetical protein